MTKKWQLFFTQKKRAVILLEFLIALSLMAILLTFLFSFFVQSAKIEKKLDTTRMLVSKRSYLQIRLQSVLSSIDRSTLNPCFYTKMFEKEKKVSLIVQFDNGIDPEPAFSGTLIGRIYLDSEKNLNLATWPLTQEKNPPWRNEILYSNIKDFEFEFLGSATDPEKNESMRAITPNFAWRTRWPKSIGAIPGIVRLTLHVEKEQDPIRYALILPVSEPFITYREKIAQ